MKNLKLQKGISTRHKPSVRIKNTTAGITLIALVITIIVLLILAGVSISLVVGENGVLTQASTSVVKTREANAAEDVGMAWTSADTEYWDEWTNNSSAKKSDYLTADNLNKYLADKGTVSKVKDNGDGTHTVTYTSAEDDMVYEIIVNSGGKTTVASSVHKSQVKGTLASQITEANYGDYVNYEMDLGLTLNLEGESTTPKTDWRIFYKDEEQDRVYLIAADYVPSTSSLLKASSAGMTANGTYDLSWRSAPSSLSTVNRQDSIFGITDSSYALNASKNNSKCVSNLLDTDHWSNFVDSTVADYAIGGPTIEMYTNSWNAKGYGTLTPSTSKTDGTNSGHGYYINDANYANMSSDAGYGNNLYYPHKSRQSSCFGYWLASPSARYADNVLFVCYDGSVNYYGYINGICGVRPVVSLKSGITAIKDANDVWQL